MDFQDKKLKCIDCRLEFIFSAGEQQFFSTIKLANEPKRCPNCRLVLRFSRTGRDTKQLTEVSCADCKRVTMVPFKPRGHRPIYCTDCLAVHRIETNTGVGKTDELVALGANSVSEHSYRQVLVEVGCGHPV